MEGGTHTHTQVALPPVVRREVHSVSTMVSTYKVAHTCCFFRDRLTLLVHMLVHMLREQLGPCALRVRSCLADSEEHATEPALQVQAAHRSSFSNPLQLQQLRVEHGKASAGVGACSAAHAATLRLALRQQGVAGPSKVRSRTHR